jgi:uroporphyrinogen-III synthase
MLMDPKLGVEERVQVDEMVVYKTRELEEFEFHFSQELRQTGIEGQGERVRWVVVFSPMAGKGMLKALGWLDERSGRVKRDLGVRKTFVACIGPTTREYLQKEFGFEADVVAEKPSPQGIKNGIENFMRNQVS